MRITETEGRNPSETEAEAEAHKVMNHGTGRSSPTSKLYSEVLAEEEKQVRKGRHTLGIRNIRR
jgi:hypothetical protein